MEEEKYVGFSNVVFALRGIGWFSKFLVTESTVTYVGMDQPENIVLNLLKMGSS